MKTECCICFKTLWKKPSEISRNKSGLNCCKNCFGEYARKNGFGKSNTGRKASYETKNKLKAARVKRVGALAPSYKGEKAGYFAKHAWMRKTFGTPKACEDCRVTNPSIRYEWANLSGQYLRTRSDWKRLCKECHARLDQIGANRMRNKFGQFV